MSRRPERDQGSMSVEIVILAPVVLVFLYLLADIGRLAEAHGQVQSAARDAVRAASVQRSATAGDAAATKAVQDDLGGLCPGASPVSSAGNSFQPGTTITYTLTCPVKVVPLLGNFFETTMSATAAAPLETYRRSG